MSKGNQTGKREREKMDCSVYDDHCISDMRDDPCPC